MIAPQRRLRSAILPVMGVVGAFIWSASQGTGQQEPTDARCKLAAAYSTIIMVPDGQELQVDDVSRTDLLSDVRACVESLLPPAALTTYRDTDAKLGGPPDTASQRQQRDLVRIEIAALVSPDVSIRQQRVVARRLAGGDEAATAAVRGQKADELLKVLGWAPPEVKGQKRDATQYVAACQSAGVAVPGPLATDKGWSQPKTLDHEVERYLILNAWSSVNVWTYRDQGGGYCVMLKREKAESTGLPPAIGTICVNANESHACFFDNVVPEGQSDRRLGFEEFQSTAFSSLIYPLDGGDDCSSCHVGSNPFLVDPKSDLGTTVRKMYSKIGTVTSFTFAGFDGVSGSWYNFDSIKEATPGTGCFECHTLPHVTKGHRFCPTIAWKAANTTMPPGHWQKKPTGRRPEFWPDSRGCFDSSMADLDSFFESMRQIRSLCDGTEIPACIIVDESRRQ